jgi:C-terminal processing protease CtpA/Prc
MRLFAAIACAALSLSAQPTTRSNVAPFLTFERVQGDRPAGWGAYPTSHVFSDDQVFHDGKRSVRVERQPGAEGDFSGVTLAVPVDFGGQTIQYSGWIRTEGLTGMAAIWMREDGESPQENALAFATIQHLNVHGDTEWKEYTISVPVHRNARHLVFGFIASGAGKAWADDLQLRVDGKPIADAPKAERTQTVLDTDHEFDHGSRVAFTELTATQIENLATLGKVWGFLKYHHPVITGGARHWDYDLFRILPEILKAPDRATANAAIAKWIPAVPDTPATNPALPAAEVLQLKPDVDWIRSEAALGPDLSRALQSAYRHRGAKQFFVGQIPNVHNPIFDIEPAYGAVALPDAGFQLLGVFRYWNIIRYWFPNRDIIGEDWDKVLPEFIPKIALAKTADDYKRQFLTLIARVHDTHANLWSSLNVRPPVGRCLVPVIVRFVDGRAVVAGHFNEAAAASVPLKRGDILDALDGVPVADLIQQWRPYYADSNDAAMLRDMSRTLTVGPCGDLKIHVRRGAESLDVTAARVSGTPPPRDGISTHDIAGDAFRLLSEDVAYVKISALKSDDAAKYIDTAAKTKGLIIDIRNYPSDFPIFRLGGLLVDKETPFARFTRGDVANPGAFLFDGTPTALQPLKPHYSGKVVVLVDEVSQSSAEYHAMAFRSAPGAIVIGSQTAGADGNVSNIPLPGGLRTMISGIGVFYPDKRPTQRVGIVPDREVKPTIAGLRDGRDELLEAAIREILGGTVPQSELEKIAKHN